MTRMGSPPLRIALFTDTWTPQVNGVSRTLERLVDHLQREGHAVVVVSPSPWKAGSGNGTPRALREPTGGGPSEAAPGPPPRIACPPTAHLPVPGVPLFLYPELLVTWAPGRTVRRKLDAFDPQVVHCATESVLGWWGRRWALKSGRPLVTSFHTNFPEYAAGYGLRIARPLAWSLLRRFHAPAARTLCPSETTRADLRERGFHDRVEVWSRGVDAKAFAPAHRSSELREEMGAGAEVLLLYVGRLAPEKRLGLLMEAFVRLRHGQGGRVALVLVGDGPMRKELEARGETDVFFAGYRTGAALAAAYASGDIFAFPSDTETFGNVVVEAMASGLPVVGVNRGGVRDIIQEGETGFLVPPGDPVAFSEALAALVRDARMRARMGTCARRDAESRSWPRILDGVIEHYREALS